MYIWDALYGKIEFSPLVYKCMLSPEVQRLREVRLCNINSLCITGSSNTNRFEHSVGTAYLAAINIEAAVQKHLKLTKKEKETFIIAALLHDVANGPFGHSYEYIMEKKGFIPEQGLGDVLGDVVSTGIGAHKNSGRHRRNSSSQYLHFQSVCYHSLYVSSGYFSIPRQSSILVMPSPARSAMSSKGMTTGSSFSMPTVFLSLSCITFSSR